MASSSHQPGKNKAVSTSKPGGQKYGVNWFDDFQMVDDESVVDQAYTICRMIEDDAKSCPQLHYALNDKEELVNVIIEKLPESWEDYAATLKDMQMQKELSFGDLVNHLRVEEKKRAQYQKVEFVKEEKEYSRYLPFLKASPLGDSAATERFFDQDPGAFAALIFNELSQTALPVAAAERRNTNDFVKELVDKKPPGNEKRTPFTLAATNGKSDTLLLFPDEDSAARLMGETIGSGYYEREEYSRYLPLYKAALRGDWVTAERFFDQDSGALTAPIHGFPDTALFVAAVYGRNTNDFVKKLVDKMPPGRNTNDYKAYGNVLNWAAYVGNTEAVKVLLSKNPSLVYFRDDNNNKRTPFIRAATNGKRDTLLYLLEFVKNDEDSSRLFPDEDSAAYLMTEIILSGYYDIALYLIKKYPAYTMRSSCAHGLKFWATKAASPFKSGTHYRWWQRIIYDYVPVKAVECILSPTLIVSIENPVDHPDQVMGRSSYKWAARLLVEYFCISVPCIKHIQKQKEMHLLTVELVKCFCKGIASLPHSAMHMALTKQAMLSAARNGIPEIVHEIVESFPNLLGTNDREDSRFVFEKAVLERQENVFNLVYQMGKYSRELVLHQYDGKGNHILHLAGKLAPPTKLSQISGAALQLQLELQWFEAVKKLLSPRDIEWRNDDGKTPAMIFTEEHKQLVAEGEKWMKKTANSCTIPAVLIVTTVFAAAITIPSGIDGTKGSPILNKKVVFNIFAVSDAISLFTSTTSLLVHLSILTSRFAEHDFLFALPNRLIIGLLTLFVSITAMLIAFSCAIYLLFGNRAWILYPVAGLACVPIISFASLQYPLLRDLMKSTYGPGIFGKQSEVPFYN